MNRASTSTRLAAIACLLFGPSTALAGPNLTPETGVDFFPLTVGQWKSNSLGPERRVEARAALNSGRTEVHWRVVFVSANDRDTFAETDGMLELSQGHAGCESPRLFFVDRLPRDPVRERRFYVPLREELQRLYSGSGSTFFGERSRAGLVPKPVPFVSLFCGEIRNLCAQRGEGWVSSVIPSSFNLEPGAPPPVVQVDCSRLEAEETRCHGLAEERDQEWAAVLEKRRQQLELDWSCAALVFPTFEDDGSVKIVARGRDGFTWGNRRVEPPWLGIRPTAWIFAPATAVGDVGVMSAQALWTALWAVVF